MKSAKLYIVVISTAFVTLGGILLFLPRSTYSELEKRDLAKFPEFSIDKLKDASFTTELAQWFSDTEPFRDQFMSVSMNLRDKMRFSFVPEEETVSFHASNQGGSEEKPQENVADPTIEDYENHINADENAKIASVGIIIVGKEPNVRALNAFGGEVTGGGAFANTVSEYARELPGVNVYALIAPLSSEFYTPEKAKNTTKPQGPFIRNVFSKLTDGAKGVSGAYNSLSQHVDEDIYLRTDHHWAPLGAFYAAQEFAKLAGVPFKDLSAYDRKVVHGYVGSMYGYSNDISVKKSPEDFVYYVPKISHTTTYRNYTVNKDFKVTSESAPATGPFFYHYKDGSGGAYCTFMGGDQRLTHVHSDAGTGRKLLIIKDSYGNPVPSFLFYSFDDIHVVDFRYFPRNMKQYVKDNGITDILFAVSVFNAYSSTSAARMQRFLTQSDGSFAAPTKQVENIPAETKPADNTPAQEAPAQETPVKEPQKPDSIS